MASTGGVASTGQACTCTCTRTRTVTAGTGAQRRPPIRSQLVVVVGRQLPVPPRVATKNGLLVLYAASSYMPASVHQTRKHQLNRAHPGPSRIFPAKNFNGYGFRAPRRAPPRPFRHRHKLDADLGAAAKRRTSPAGRTGPRQAPALPAQPGPSSAGRGGGWGAAFQAAPAGCRPTVSTEGCPTNCAAASDEAADGAEAASAWLEPAHVIRRKDWRCL